MKVFELDDKDPSLHYLGQINLSRVSPISFLMNLAEGETKNTTAPSTWEIIKNDRVIISLVSLLLTNILLMFVFVLVFQCLRKYCDKNNKTMRQKSIDKGAKYEKVNETKDLVDGTVSRDIELAQKDDRKDEGSNKKSVKSLDQLEFQSHIIQENIDIQNMVIDDQMKASLRQSIRKRRNQIIQQKKDVLQKA